MVMVKPSLPYALFLTAYTSVIVLLFRLLFLNYSFDAPSLSPIPSPVSLPTSFPSPTPSSDPTPYPSITHHSSFSFATPPVPVMGRKLRLLFFSHGYNYETGMDRFFFIHYYALRDHPWIDVALWGIGIDGYNASLTIRQNLMERYGSIHFDVLYLYGMTLNHQILEVSKDLIVLVRENECWDRRCLPFFTANGASLVMLNFAREVLLYQDLANQSLIVHTPQSTDPDIFYHPVTADRDIDILFVGAADKVVYPLRYRLKQLIDQKKLPGYIRNHPGYFAKPWTPEYWHGYEMNMTRLAISEDQVKDYAELLKRAKICLVDSSVYKYAYQKYTELPMAGCLMVADIPHERMDEFRQGMVEVTMDMSDDEIVSTIMHWLSNDTLRIEKATIAQKNALKYSAKNWGSTVIDSVNRIKTTGYGMVFNHQFEFTCAAESMPHGKPKNMYCRN